MNTKCKNYAAQNSSLQKYCTLSQCKVLAVLLCSKSMILSTRLRRSCWAFCACTTAVCDLLNRCSVAQQVLNGIFSAKIFLALEMIYCLSCEPSWCSGLQLSLILGTTCKTKNIECALFWLLAKKILPQIGTRISHKIFVNRMLTVCSRR